MALWRRRITCIPLRDPRGPSTSAPDPALRSPVATDEVWQNSRADGRGREPIHGRSLGSLARGELFPALEQWTLNPGIVRLKTRCPNQPALTE